MAEIWERTFAASALLWGLEPARSAVRAANVLAEAGARSVLIPGFGYGRNAAPFLARGMTVTGIEISRTAIGLARRALGLDLQIHEGSVANMPFDNEIYDASFCHGLLYLLDAEARAKLIADCHRQLAPGGTMIFTVIRKTAPMYGTGTRLGEDWYETSPGVAIYFYDESTLTEALGAFGSVELMSIDEPAGGATFPFMMATCRTATEHRAPPT